MANTLSSATKRSGEEDEKKETGVQEDWVEEEIERLLQQVDPDDPEHEAQEQLRDGPVSTCTPGGQARVYSSVYVIMHRPRVYGEYRSLLNTQPPITKDLLAISYLPCIIIFSFHKIIHLFDLVRV